MMCSFSDLMVAANRDENGGSENTAKGAENRAKIPFSGLVDMVFIEFMRDPADCKPPANWWGSKSGRRANMQPEGEH